MSPAWLKAIVEKLSKDLDAIARAKVVVEAANRPMTNIADEIFSELGVVVIPDILANSGGVIVSYCEWVQNLQHMSWSLETVRGTLDRRLQSAAREVFARAADTKCSYRYASYQGAMQRLKEAVFIAGF